MLAIKNKHDQIAVLLKIASCYGQVCCVLIVHYGPTCTIVCTRLLNLNIISTNQGGSVFHLAAFSGNKKIVTQYIQQELDINRLDKVCIYFVAFVHCVIDLFHSVC